MSCQQLITVLSCPDSSISFRSFPTYGCDTPTCSAICESESPAPFGCNSAALTALALSAASDAFEFVNNWGRFGLKMSPIGDKLGPTAKLPENDGLGLRVVRSGGLAGVRVPVK